MNVMEIRHWENLIPKAMQFYNPSNGTLVSSIDYKFQYNVTSGAHFGLKYQPGIFIYRLDESTSVFAPQFSLETLVYVHAHSPPATAKIIGIPTYDRPNIYTVAFRDGSISEYADDLLSPVSDTTQLTPSSLLPKWIKGGINVTLFLNYMPKPKHGTLQLSSEGHWYLYPGKQIDRNGIHMSNFEQTDRIFWTQANYSKVTLNLKTFVQLNLRFLSRIAFFIMFLLMGYSLSLPHHH